MEKLTVVKIGGNIINNAQQLDHFLSLFSDLQGPKVLIHGGGHIATQYAKRLNISTQMIDGRRVTSLDMLDVATMTYAGLINKNVVADLQAMGCNAIGMSGADGNVIRSIRRRPQPIDYGYVGDITEVNHAIIKSLLSVSIFPVICAITHDGHGQLLNTNADTVATQVAIAMSSAYDVDLMYCFEHKGVLLDINDPLSVIQTITPGYFNTLISQEKIADGMIPKLTNCIKAIQSGVKSVFIGSVSMLDKKDTIKTHIKL